MKNQPGVGLRGVFEKDFPFMSLIFFSDLHPPFLYPWLPLFRQVLLIRVGLLASKTMLCPAVPMVLFIGSCLKTFS